MGSLTSCLKSHRAGLAAGDEDVIVSRAAELRDGGMKASEAGQKAVRDLLSEAIGARNALRPAAAPASDPVGAPAPVSAEAQAAQPTEAELQAQQAQQAEAAAAKQRAADERKAAIEARRVERETERSIFRELMANPEVVGMSEKNVAVLVDAKAGDQVAPDKRVLLARAIHKEAAKKAAEIAKQKHRDPAVFAAALGSAKEQDNIATDDPAMQAAYALGWTHALSGKTKSTLTGDLLNVREHGYEAARKWMQTEEGAAWHEGRSVNKLQNTGIDLRRWYEQLREQMKAGESDIQKAWKQIESATTRADLFAPLLPDGVTPGFRLYVTKLRDEIRPFKAWLESSYRWDGGFQFRSRRLRRDASNIDMMLDGSRYPSTYQFGDKNEVTESDQASFKSDEAFRAEWLRERAREYIEAVRGITSVIDGASSVDEAARKWHERFIMTFSDRRWASDASLLTPAGKPLVTLGAHTVWTGNVSDIMDLSHESTWTKGLIANEATVALPNKATPLTRPRLDKISREGGPDLRQGRSVTPDDAKTRFGFADVGFGDWVAAGADQDHLNYAWDAFSDLAAHFGVPVDAVGFGGQLYFTIGALGHGKHAAHFSPNQPSPLGPVQVINITNTRGDGSLYHEWTHALDHFLGGDWQQVVRPWLMRLFTHGAMTPDDVNKRAQQFLTGGWYFKSDKSADKVDAAIRGLGSWKRPASAYKANADALGADYWGNEMELLARAAESWAYDTLGHQSTYLVDGWVEEGKITQAAGYRGTPYPTGVERKHFNLALAALAKAIEWDNGRPTVSAKAFRDALPDELKAGEQRKLELLSRDAMQAYYDQLLAEQADKAAAEAQAKADEAEAERRRMDDMAEQKLRELQPQTPPVVDVPQPSSAEGPLSDQDLSDLFDQAAAELREETQEQPDAPPPGGLGEDRGSWTYGDWETIHRLLAKGVPVLLSEEGHGLPTIHSFARLGRTDMVGFGVFKTVGDGWTANWEGGGAMDRTPSGKPYTTIQFSGGEIPAAAYDMQAAADAALANKRALGNPDRSLSQGTSNPAASSDPRARDLIAQAAALGVKGADEALTGLTKLFGGSPGRLNSFPAGFDEETYKQAKPHFASALKAFQEAGKTLKDLFKLLIQNFGDGVKMYAVQFAKDQALGNDLSQQAQIELPNTAAPDAQDDRPPAARLAHDISKHLRHVPTPMEWRTLFNMADRAYGGTQAEGKYTPKDAYDALEAGINLHILSRPGAFNPSVTEEDAQRAVVALTALLKKVPTQTKRTAEQDKLQQFSTVPTLAFVANWVANVGPTDTMLEPSAGVGGLAVFARHAGAQVVLNEWAAGRAALLQQVLPGARVFREDAQYLHNILPDDVQPTVVVMNPPFSNSIGGVKDTMVGAEHVEQALQRLPHGGRLVAIVGEGMAMDKPAFRDWWKKIGAKYDVRAAVPMDGKGYAKYGTTFDNVILVIDKIKPSGRKPVTTRATEYTELVHLLAGVRNERPAHDQPITDRRPEPDARGATGRDAAEGDGVRSDTGQTESGVAAGLGTGESGSGPSLDRGGKSVRGAGRGKRAGADAGGLHAGKADGSQDANRGGANNAAVDGRPDSAGEQSGVAIGAQTVDSGELTDSVFESYQPQRLQVPGAKPHPGALVQSAAMASVLPPAPTYTPNLPKETVERGLLSIAQIEAVVYAGQAHQSLLETKVTDVEARDYGLKAGTPYRTGFFIGDGTGTGKGREASGIILDNIRQGRKKHVWVSEKQGLMQDAARDFAGIQDGMTPQQVLKSKAIFNQGATKAADAIGNGEGILFTTYATLRSAAKAAGEQKPNESGKPKKEKGKTRVDQIVEWAGSDFDGVIVLDECHNAGNAVAMKGARGNSDPSEQALAAVELQRRLPSARVVYVSATGATEVSNLSFATRLGIWGPGTPFPSVSAFVNEMTAGGLAAMELVARDLKQTGAYMARSLSYSGVDYSRVEHELTTLQHDIYNRMADAWQVVLNNIEQALKAIGAVSESGKTKNSKAKANAMSAFWGAQQRFFSQIITSMQMPSVIDAVEADIARGEAVVLQLVNTNEAQQERAMAKRREEGKESDLEDLDLTPRDQLIDMVRKSFPVQQYRDVIDEEGKRSTVAVEDSNGNPVLNKEAVAIRDRLIEDLQQISVPDGPLEILINHFGPELVAEVTGRKQRVVSGRWNKNHKGDGEAKAFVDKRGAASARADADAFMADKKRVLVFSDAGGTGFSFQADLTKANQRKRQHYLVQPGWRANKAVQGLGRTHRTNQASAPHYKLVSTNIPAHKRFLSSIARRLDQLGALTKGQRDTSSGGLFSEKDNLESKYAERAVRAFLADAKAGQIEGLEFRDLLQQLGLKDMLDQQGMINESKIPDVRQFLNRLLSLKLETQEVVFNAFIGRMEELIEVAAERGELDTGMQTLRALESKVSHEEVVHTDERTGAETSYVELELTHPTRMHSFPSETAQGAKIEWVVNVQSGRVWGRVRSGNQTLKSGGVVERFRMLGTGGMAFRTADDFRNKDAWKLISEDEARQKWEQENAKKPPTYTTTERMIVGAMLPIWDRLKTEGTMQVARTNTSDGRRMLGRLIHKDDVDEIRKRLNIAAPESRLPPIEVLARVLKGDVAELANGWRLERARVSDDLRVEIRGLPEYPSKALVSELTGIGAIQERIGWKERFFVPVSGADVLAALTKHRPVVGMSRPDATPVASRGLGDAGRGVSVDTVRRMVAEVAANWDEWVLRQSPVTVVPSASALPADVVAGLRVSGAYGTADALMMPDGRVYLIADRITSMEHAQKLLFHEVYGHVGLRAFLGEQYESTMDMLRMANESLAAEANTWYANFGRAQIEGRVRSGMSRPQAERIVRLLAVEEALADRAADNPPPSGWKALMAKLQQALRRMNLGFVADWLENMTEAETFKLLMDARRAIMRTGGSVKPFSGTGAWASQRHGDSTVDASFRDTERAYGGRDAYDRAKAAGRTKLTYGQWVQVRTPEFKAWFGDWEAVRAQKRLDAMAPIEVRIPDEWRGLTTRELRDRVSAALDEMVRGREAIDHPELGRIQVGRAGAKKVLHEGRDPAKLLVAADAGAVLPLSIYAGSTAAHGRNVDGYGKLLARVDVGGTQLTAIFSVRHQPDGSWFYNAATVAETTTPAEAGAATSGPVRGASDRSEGHPLLTEVEQFSRRPLNRVNPDTVSKVVDPDTGEPMVVYHGTTKDFYAFDPEKRGSNTRVSDARKGFFFAASSKAASEFTWANGEMVGSVMPVFLSIPATFEVRLPGEWEPAKYDAALDYAKRDGRDGVIIRGATTLGTLGDVFVVFRPAQIKSAIGNSGAFDPGNDDIRFSQRRRTRKELLWAEVKRNTEGQEFYGNGIGLIAMQQLVVDDFAPDHLSFPLGHAFRVQDGHTVHRFIIVDQASSDVLGEAVLEVDSAGNVEAIHDIEVNAKGQGTGQSVVEAILANAPGEVRLIEVLDQSVGFWDRMGAGYRNVYGDATTEWATFQAAQQRATRQRSDARALPGDHQGDGQELEAQRGAEGIAEEGAGDPDAEGRPAGTGIIPILSQRGPVNPVLESARRKAGIGGPRTLGQKIKAYFGRAVEAVRDREAIAQTFRQEALDQFYGILRAERAELGALPVEQSHYVTARLANGGTSSVMRGLMLHGQARWNDNHQHLEKIQGTNGLLDILKPLGGDLNDWFGWMVGNRAARLMAEGRENNLSADEIRALQGLADTEDKVIAFRRAAIEYAAFKRSVLDVAQEAGLINQDSRRVWDHADYIPFYREIDERSLFSPTGRKGLAGQSSGIRTLKGGEAALNDPMENLLMNFSRLIDASLKNNAIKQTIEALGETDLVQKVGYDMAPAIVPRQQIVAELVRAGTPESIIATLPDEVFEGMARMWSIKPPSDPDVVRIMVGGKPQFYRVNDRLLLKALTSFVPFDFPGLSIARGAKRMLTAMVTATPEYMARNWIRDSLAAQAITVTPFDLTESVKGIGRAFRESGGYEAMLFAGASFQSGQVNAADPAGTAIHMRRAMRERGFSASAQADGVLAAGWDRMAHGWEVYRQIGEAIENANREAVYEAATRAGKSSTEAAFEAKDLMDFSLRGSSAAYQLMADVLPFFNSRVQGLYRVGRADPQRLMKVGAIMVAATAMLAFFNTGEDWYEQLPDWDKDTYWHFRIGGKHFRLPKPFELGVLFATLPERIARGVLGYDSGKKTISRVWANVRDQLAFDIMPQLVRPAVDAWANKDTFRDRPIEGMADEGMRPHARFDARTSDTARVLAGAAAPVVDFLDMGPKKIEHMVNGYFGTVGMYTLAVSDAVIRRVEGKPDRPAMRGDDLPIIRVFYQEDPARATVFESDVYKMRREIEAIVKEVNTAAKSADPSQKQHAKDLKGEEASKIKVRGIVTGATKQLGVLNQQISKVYNDPKMTPDEKRAQVDKLHQRKADVARKAATNERVREVF